MSPINRLPNIDPDMLDFDLCETGYSICKCTLSITEIRILILEYATPDKNGIIS